jgi:hypothetical protein
MSRLKQSRDKLSRTRGEAQLSRFKEMAIEVQADASPDALDRAFGRLDMKKKAIAKPAKRTTKEKR